MLSNACTRKWALPLITEHAAKGILPEPEELKKLME
jgi:hypothetical protein